MKKKVIIISVVIILLVLLFPVRTELKDGGTVRYKSFVYEVSKVHTLIATGEEEEGEDPYARGIVIKIFGFEIYNDVK